MNRVFLVGKISIITEVKEGVIVSIAVPRSYKREDGITESDFIDCYLIGGIAEATKKYCKSKDTIGVNARIETTYLKGEKTMRIIAEKVSFLSSDPSLVEKEDE